MNVFSESNQVDIIPYSIFLAYLIFSNSKVSQGRLLHPGTIIDSLQIGTRDVYSLQDVYLILKSIQGDLFFRENNLQSLCINFDRDENRTQISMLINIIS